MGVKSQPILTDEDLKALLKTQVKSYKSRKSNKAMNGKVDILIKLLWETGARISEAVSLLKADIEYDDNKQYFVTFKKTKNKMDRRIPIKYDLAMELKRLSSKNDKYVFKGYNGGHWNRTSAFEAFKQRLEASKLDKKITPHTFRHRFITDKLNKKQPLHAVMHYVGHKHATSTQQYYHFTTQGLVDVLEA